MSLSLNRREFLGTLAAASALAMPAAPAVKEPWGGAFIIMQTPFLESLEVQRGIIEARDGISGEVRRAGNGVARRRG